MKRVVPAENLAVEYISLRLPEMEETYRQMTRVVHWLLARAFSNEVVTPGKTTNLDVAWWLRQKNQELGLGTWFQPTVRVQKPKPVNANLDEPVVIERGDVLHCDYGLVALGLKTDTQHMGYVLKPGESQPPLGIRAALKQAQRLQNLVLERFKPGRSGNAVLADSRAAMLRNGIKGSIYSHPIGDHGHGAGPIIGLWDRQEAIPGRGDLPLLPSTWFSIELSIRHPIPEWGGTELFVGMEEDAILGADGGIRWVLSRQENFHLVR
jgi:Xaa-Pro aminopeptidase